MAQFSVYRNPNPGSRRSVPLLLDVQTDLLSGIGTRVVVPLCPLDSIGGPPAQTLMPVFEIEGDRFAMITPQLAGVSRKDIGPLVADLAQQRPRILAALDLLITGI